MDGMVGWVDHDRDRRAGRPGGGRGCLKGGGKQDGRWDNTFRCKYYIIMRRRSSVERFRYRRTA